MTSTSMRMFTTIRPIEVTRLASMDLIRLCPTQIAEIAAAQQAKVQARNADTLGTRAAFSYDNRQMMMRGGSGVAAPQRWRYP